MGEYLTITRVILQRIGDDIGIPALTLYAPSVQADGALHGVGLIDIQMEDYAGELRVGQVEIRVCPERALTLHSRPGGMLADLSGSDSVYILAVVYGRVTGGAELPLIRGRVIEIAQSHGDGILTLLCDCGLAIYADRDASEMDLSYEEWIGRPLDLIVSTIATHLTILGTTIDEPIITYDDPRVSYAEHPERRYADPMWSIPTPSTHSYALAVGGGEVWCCVDKLVLSYNPTTRRWTSHGNLTGMDAIDYMGFRVTHLEYEAGPQLRAQVEHMDESLGQGTSPNFQHSEVYEVIMAL